jgi:hypothetical protein
MSKVCGMVVDNKVPVYDYHWLCEKMKSRELVCLRYNLGQIYGVINGIRPEDGSGRHWLVTLYDEHRNKSEIYVRAE